MKDIRAAISRILEVDRATDMEAALFVLRQMDLAVEWWKEAPRPYNIPIVWIAAELLDELENPFARKLLFDRVNEYALKQPSGDGPFRKAPPKEKP